MKHVKVLSSERPAVANETSFISLKALISGLDNANSAGWLRSIVSTRLQK